MAWNDFLNNFLGVDVKKSAGADLFDQGGAQFGGERRFTQELFQNADLSRTDNSVNIFGSSGISGITGATTKKTTRIEQTEDEGDRSAPLSIAPAVIGGGTTTATGGGDASAGIPILPIVGVLVVGVGGYLYFGGKVPK